MFAISSGSHKIPDFPAETVQILIVLHTCAVLSSVGCMYVVVCMDRRLRHEDLYSSLHTFFLLCYCCIVTMRLLFSQYDV